MAADAPGGAGDNGPATAGVALRWATTLLRQAGCDSPRLDAEVLLGYVTGQRREAILAHPERPMTADGAARFRDLVARRRARCPVAYLTGRREFMSLEFEVGPGALVPRPETELLVEVAVALAEGRTPAGGQASAGRGLTLADVGTGSGAVAVTLARLLPGARILATDISPRALNYAARNAARLLPLRGGEAVAAGSPAPAAAGPAVVSLHQGDLLDALRALAPRPVIDGVVANLPYVADADWATLPPDVRDHEPAESLLGGPDGLDLFRRLASQLPAYLAPGGFVCLEVGLGQAPAVRSILAATGLFTAITTHRDLAACERVVSAQR